MSDPLPLPTTPDAARSEIERTRADTSHAYHRGDSAAVDRMLELHRVLYAPPPADAPPSPPAPEEHDARRQARIAELANDPRRLAGDPWLNDEYGNLLLGGDVKQPETEEPERAPVTFAAEQLPRFSLPADVPHDDPDVRALQEITAHAGLPSSVMQTAINRVVDLAKQPLPEERAEWSELMERDGARAIREARQRYGSRWQEMRDHVAMGKAILLAEAPQVYALIHSHPHMLNSMELFETLAALGARSRGFHVSKYGTSRAVQA